MGRYKKLTLLHSNDMHGDFFSEEKGKDVDRFRISMDFGQWDFGFKGLDKVILEAYRILKNSGTIICFYDLWKISVLKQYFDNENICQLRV